MSRLAGLVLAAALTSCASLAPAPGGPPVPPKRAPAAEPGTPPVPVPVPVTVVTQPPAIAPGPRPWMPADSLPSSQALAVISRIPDPIAGSPPVEGARGGAPVPPPRSTPPPRPTPPAPATADTTMRAPMRSAPAPADAYDTLRVSRPPNPPAPVPTPVLGERRPPPVDSVRSAPPASPPAVAPAPKPTPPAPSPAAANASAPDTCWRVQLAAPSERARAEAARDAAQSVLLTPMSIELDQSRWKVRTTACLARAAAERLRQRALDSGFEGVFLVRGESRP